MQATGARARENPADRKRNGLALAGAPMWRLHKIRAGKETRLERIEFRSAARRAQGLLAT